MLGATTSKVYNSSFESEQKSVTEQGWREFNAEKKGTAKIDSIFNTGSSVKVDEKQAKKLDGADLLSMMDDL